MIKTSAIVKVDLPKPLNKENTKQNSSEEQLLVNAMDLFSAGSETTATTLAWAVGDLNMICVSVICVNMICVNMICVNMICVNVHDVRDHRHNLGLGGGRHEHDMCEHDMCEHDMCERTWYARPPPHPWCGRWVAYVDMICVDVRDMPGQDICWHGMCDMLGRDIDFELLSDETLSHRWTTCCSILTCRPRCRRRWTRCCWGSVNFCCLSNGILLDLITFEWYLQCLFFAEIRKKGLDN